MSGIMEVTFASILHQVPSLLEACIAQEVSALRRLRLVSKEISRVALQGLTSYTVSLKGVANDTNVGGSRLLQQTCLRELTVYLQLTGGHMMGIRRQNKITRAGTKSKKLKFNKYTS